MDRAIPVHQEKVTAMMNENQLAEALAKSPIYRDYETAYNEITGQPLALRPVETWQLPHHGQKAENPFCSMMASRSRSCSACLQVQQELAECAHDGPASVTCPAGMTDTAVPVKLGERIIGYLHTGQIFQQEPTEALFKKTLALVRQWGVGEPEEKLREAFFNTRVVTGKEYDSAVKLLGIFAEHLSLVSNQLTVRQENAEPPMITRAKAYIHEHQEDELSLGQVAKAVNCSPFYFCKMFRKHTGINFTDYVSRVRIERAKNLLLNPNIRVSEIAYEVGFQSLTHFNRVFKRIVGQSPTGYRAHLPHA
jgi:AraC-like DNA-binding protein/ligand-binding sensor protein